MVLKKAKKAYNKLTISYFISHQAATIAHKKSPA